MPLLNLPRQVRDFPTDFAQSLPTAAEGCFRECLEASITARPFFESQGFAMVTPQVVVLRRVEFVNYRMERMLAEPDSVLSSGLF